FTGGTAYSGKLIRPVDMNTLRTFFDEKSQQKQLVLAADGVKEVEGSDGHRFVVKYQGEDKGRVVNLVNKPEGDDVAAREKSVAKRVTSFPDPSVEQSFPSEGVAYDKEKPGQTPVFSARTSEKEIEVVQTVLDRLLRDDKTGEGLLKRTYLKADP